MNTTTETKWKMPEWMVKYIPLITTNRLATKQGIELCMNGYNQENDDYINKIHAKVELLQQLYDKRII